MEGTKGRAILHITAAATRGTREEGVHIANGSLIGVISLGVGPRQGGRREGRGSSEEEEEKEEWRGGGLSLPWAHL